MRSVFTITGTLAILTGCTTVTADAPPVETIPVATAMLHAADGTARGRAVLTESNGAIRLTVDAQGLPAGSHGIHLHTVGRCDAPDFQTAGAHWNPTMKMHGRDNPMGAHDGDLPNLVIEADGRGSVSVGIAGAWATLLDADGAAVVVHAGPDDYRTDPSGNSGGRIACGVLSRP